MHVKLTAPWQWEVNLTDQVTHLQCARTHAHTQILVSPHGGCDLTHGNVRMDRALIGALWKALK